MFKQQASKARATYLNKKWNEGSLGRSAFRNSGHSAQQRTFDDKSFGDFANKAYKAKHGYAIRRNPKTGEKEMFVRGTTFKRGGIEWLQNLAEAPGFANVGLGEQLVGDVSRHFRGKYSKFLSSIAKKERVTAIYGHSRGGAIVNDMEVPGARKIGLDAATILNRVPRITNYRQRQGFDAFIGANARSTIKQSKWTPLGSKRYHKYWSK